MLYYYLIRLIGSIDFSPLYASKCTCIPSSLSIWEVLPTVPRDCPSVTFCSFLTLTFLSRFEYTTTKLNYIGDKVIRGYSEKEPSYSKTLDVWETHKGVDISCTKGKEVKSLLNGIVVDVFDDEEYGQ